MVFGIQKVDIPICVTNVCLAAQPYLQYHANPRLRRTVASATFCPSKRLPTLNWYTARLWQPRAKRRQKEITIMHHAVLQSALRQQHGERPISIKGTGRDRCIQRHVLLRDIRAAIFWITFATCRIYTGDQLKNESNTFVHTCWCASWEEGSEVVLQSMLPWQSTVIYGTRLTIDSVVPEGIDNKTMILE